MPNTISPQAFICPYVSTKAMAAAAQSHWGQTHSAQWDRTRWCIIKNGKYQLASAHTTKEKCRQRLFHPPCVVHRTNQNTAPRRALQDKNAVHCRSTLSAVYLWFISLLGDRLSNTRRRRTATLHRYTCSLGTLGDELILRRRRWIHA